MQAPLDRLHEFDAITDVPRRTYAAMLSAMDDAVGKVIKKVRAEGLESETLIFFLSDNGGPTMKGTTINASRNAPLRGSKRTTLEGGIRVPFVISWKDHLPAGALYEHPVIQLDVQPTALAAAGVEIDPRWKLDGVDLHPHITGKTKTKPHESLYWRLGDQFAIRHGDWKLVSYDLNVDGISGKGVSEPRLYHLTEDIGESRQPGSQPSPGSPNAANPVEWMEFADGDSIVGTAIDRTLNMGLSRKLTRFACESGVRSTNVVLDSNLLSSRCGDHREFRRSIGGRSRSHTASEHSLDHRR